MSNHWHQIYEKIGEAAAWEMLAEEAAELSAAAGKLARIVRGDNPSRTEYAEAFAATVNELTDVLNAADVLDSEHQLISSAKLKKPRKMSRWYNSLFSEVFGH